MAGIGVALRGLIFTVIVGVFLFPSAALAQTIDPSMLEALKNQAGATGARQTVVSPLDEKREEIHQERREALADARRKRLAKKSPLEEDFQIRLDSKITQYGYDIFANMPSGDSVMTGTISDNYILGIGDELIVTLQGSKSQSYAVQVDLEGRVIIPELAPISVTGMRYGSFREILERKVAESFIGTEVYVSLASVRRISVFVVGEVATPGVVRTSSLATPLEILMHAGGVKKTGSLRNITVYRGGEKSTIDIYALLKGGISGFEPLNDGDRIIVPTIGATIALDGDIMRPGIYELPANQKEISFAQAMALSGGTLRPSGYELSQITMDAQGRQGFHKLHGSEKISGGEAIVARLVENSQSGKVELTGHVKTAGFRSLANTSNVSDLVGNILNLKENPYLLFGVIERTDPRTRTRLLQPFSPEKILLGDKTVELVDRDRVVFLGQSDVEFLISDEVRRVFFSGKYAVKRLLPDGKENPRFCLPLKELTRIINDTLSNRFSATTRAVFVRKEAEELIGMEIDEGKANLPNQDAAAGDAVAQARIAEKLKEERETKEEEEKDQGSCPEVYKNVKGLLPFILEYIVSVDGAVRQPGVYPIVDGTSIASLVSVSGGSSNDANLAHIEVASFEDKSTPGTREMSWDYVNAHEADLATVKVNPGGSIRIGSLVSNFESGAVLLSGEFRQPGIYTIKKGEKLSDLILRAGGLTDQAYPYGAVFTRKRVKEIQREEMKQTAKHLQSAMISASVKKNIEADSLMAAQQLTNQLANAELLGRVVIEADPLKLSLEPSLDTMLEAGDALFMPKRPNFIIAMGDVLSPGALQFIPGKPVAEYLQEVGNYTRSADKSRIYVVYPNGVARPIKMSSWGGDHDLSIPPGSAIVVPTDLSPYDALSLVKEIGGIFQNLAVSAASIAVLIRN